MVAVAAGSDYHKVNIDVDRLLEAARAENLPKTWARSRDKNAVLSQRRPFVAGGSMTDVVIWISSALQELKDAKVLEPYIEQLRKQVEPDARLSESQANDQLR